MDCRGSNLTKNYNFLKKIVHSTSAIPLQWRLCSMKQRMGKDHHVQTDPSTIVEKASVFQVKMPTFGYFELQMEFKAHLGPSDLVI